MWKKYEKALKQRFKKIKSKVNRVITIYKKFKNPIAPLSTTICFIQG